MKVLKGQSALAMVVVGSFVLGGCFGPFKKKSSSGGGGGGTTETTDEEGTGTGKKTSGETGSGSGETAVVVPGAKDGYGCLQGVVTDGFTGQRIDLGDGSKMFVLIRGTKIKANVVTGDDNLKGEYFICEIPVEEDYPVYAYVDGYMPFESSVKIVSTRAKRVASDGQAVVDEVKIPDPLEMQNVRLFPLGNTSRDLRVRAIFNGSPVKDAVVDLEAHSVGSSGTFAFEGTFANSAGTRILPTRVLTGDDGYATFPASGLSLGAAYSVTVHAPVASHLTSPGHGDIVLGVSGAAASDLNTYDMNIVLGDGDQALKLLSCSTQFSNYNGDAAIKFMFNREIKIVDRENMEGAVVLTAGMKTSDGNTVTLATDSSAVNLEQLNASVSGNMLTLNPLYDTHGKPKPVDVSLDLDIGDNNLNKNGTATYTFANVLLDVVGNDSVNKIALSSLVGGMSPACSNVVRYFQEVD